MVAILKNKNKSKIIWNLYFDEAKISFFAFKKLEVQGKKKKKVLYIRCVIFFLLEKMVKIRIQKTFCICNLLSKNHPCF